MSAEQQALGDEKLRKQNWSHAYVNYRNSVDLAPERPEAHFRLGLAFTALKQYASAVREFKRSLELDSTLPQSGDKFATIFGADNKTVQTSILPNVAEWANEDLANGDHLFLLGLMLHFADDPRGSEILEAAVRTAGPNDHILAFLNSDRVLSNPDREHREPSPRTRFPSPSPSPEHENFAPLIDPSIPPSPGLPDQPALSPFPDPPPT